MSHEPGESLHKHGKNKAKYAKSITLGYQLLEITNHNTAFAETIGFIDSAHAMTFLPDITMTTRI